MSTLAGTAAAFDVAMSTSLALNCPATLVAISVVVSEKFVASFAMLFSGLVRGVHCRLGRCHLQRRLRRIAARTVVPLSVALDERLHERHQLGIGLRRGKQ